MQFGITLTAFAFTTTCDLFEYVTASTRPITILGWTIGTYTEEGDAQDESLRLELITGHTTSGNGSAATPFALDGSAVAALGTAETGAATIASAGTAVVRHAGAFNVRSGELWMPPPEMRVVIPVSTRMVLRINEAPADSITGDATLWFDE